LNCALYAISRFMPLTELATGSYGWTQQVLVPFGLVSILVSAAFIVHEHDLKRLLAYHSVEHMGIITLGLGVGATAASLFHTFNHSICKMLTFFCAGALVQRYGTRDMRRMRGILGVVPLAGAGLVLGILALIGVPPFSVFMSELWIVKVGSGQHHLTAVILFLFGAAVVFVAALKHAVEMIWSGPDAAPPAPRALRMPWLLVALPLVLLAASGVWMPSQMGTALDRAASVIGARP
jgi:hydrogenase-4 component F